jgi:hypothetical protein
VRRAAASVAVATAAALAAACGDDDERVVTTTVYRDMPLPALERTRGELPEIATRPARRGEVIIRGDQAPKTFGPYEFEPDRYDFRFAQYAPGGGVDFRTDASSFTAVMTRRAGKSGPDTQVLSNETTRSGAGTLTLSGKLYVEVQSADYSYVMRFTPREGS